MMIIIVLFVAIINILINGIGNEVTITIIFFFYESSAQRYLFFFLKASLTQFTSDKDPP